MEDEQRARRIEAQEGDERGEGRPTGLTDSSRPAAEGRPSTVREGEALTEKKAEHEPTEGAVDRGETPPTEHEPGGDM